MDTSFFDPVNDDQYIRGEVERVLASLDDKKLVNFNVFDEPLIDDDEISMTRIKDNTDLDVELSKYLKPSNNRTIISDHEDDDDDSLLRELERRVDQVMKGDKPTGTRKDDFSDEIFNFKSEKSDSRRLHEQIDRLQRENVRQQGTIKRLERLLGNQPAKTPAPVVQAEKTTGERLQAIHSTVKQQVEQAKQLHDSLIQLLDIVNAKSK